MTARIILSAAPSLRSYPQSCCQRKADRVAAVLQ
jgi:hypothetical protein